MNTKNVNASNQDGNIALEIFSTCPQSTDVEKSKYRARVVEVAKWSERYGCKGILVYTDNSIVDPWLTSEIIIENTESLCPLVAVQPIYMHPYAAAKMASSYGYFYNRQVYLNMLAGGFKNDLIALNDTTPHDRRYDRMVEYVKVMKGLLRGETLSFSGEYYKVENLKLSPPLAEELFPGILASGSSEAGIAAALAIGATPVKYPKPPGEYENEPPEGRVGAGVRVGIIARDNEEEAWKVARERFPEDRKGQLTRQLATKVSDSHWHKQISDLEKEEENNPYWLVPFQNYKTNCPYLVGSYETVGKEIGRYVGLGFTTYILDIPPQEEELYHTSKVFKLALVG